MERIVPEVIDIASFNDESAEAIEAVYRIPFGFRGQQSLTIGDYDVTLFADGELTIELATLSGADRLAIKRSHSGSVTITAKG